MELLAAIGLDHFEPARVSVGVTDADRVEIARRLREAWPGRAGRKSKVRVGQAVSSRRIGAAFRRRPTDDAEVLHAGRFGDESPLLAVHLGAGTSAKRWPPAHWNALLARFLGDGWRVVIVGGADDAVPADHRPAHPNFRDWTGRLAVTQTAAVLERADLFIGADSGPAHLASCAGVPSVILFSGTNRARQWRPWSRRSLVLKHRVGCRPCHHKTCPLADHPCMEGLAPDRVYRAAPGGGTACTATRRPIHRSDPHRRIAMLKKMRRNWSRIDVKAWIALAWAVGFGLLYAEMVLRTKAPAVWMAARRWISRYLA